MGLVTLLCQSLSMGLEKSYSHELCNCYGLHIKRKTREPMNLIYSLMFNLQGCHMASNCGHELFEFRNTRNKMIEHGVYG